MQQNKAEAVLNADLLSDIEPKIHYKLRDTETNANSSHVDMLTH